MAKLQNDKSADISVMSGYLQIFKHWQQRLHFPTLNYDNKPRQHGEVIESELEECEDIIYRVLNHRMEMMETKDIL